MKIKKYTANTMPEAMNVIRKELGPEAVILNSKEVKRGRFFGFFQKKHIEVIAAIDPEPILSQVEKPQEKIPKQDGPSVSTNTGEANDVILNEIKNLKKMIEIQSQKAGAAFSADFELAFNHLLDQEVETSIAEEIIQELINNTSIKNDQPTITEIFADMEGLLQRKLDQFPAKGITAEKKIVQFVGPTGVGKTTTIAKIAALLMMNEKLKVAFITTDTYRIAAIEQLKTYARILNVPVEVAYNTEDYKKAVQKFSGYDLILVDTAGRNFRDAKYIRDLEDMMGNFNEIATYLVLSLTSKPKDLLDIYDQFYKIPLTAVIFTKIDETTQYGSMLNIVLRKQIGIAYVTNGQDVPDNILRLSSKEISKMIAGEHIE